jgi:hypothetical protein
MHEDAVYLLEKAGFSDIDIKNVYYSLSYCQGDGAMVEFTGVYKNYIVSVTHSGRYYHERSTSITIEDVETEEDADAATYKDIEENALVPLFKELARSGYSFIDVENDPVNVSETIRSNEYTFDINGERKD